MADEKQESGEQQGIGVEYAHVSIIGANGEWLPVEDLPKIGETMKLEVIVYARKKGEEFLEGEDGGTRRFVQLKSTGVKVIG